jgi:uncharacterized protein
MVCIQSAPENGMDPIKTPLTPVVISIGLILLVESCISRFSISPLLATGLARIIEIFIMLGVFYLSDTGIAALGLSAKSIRHGIIRGILWSMIFCLISIFLGLALIIFGLNPLKLIHITLPDTTNHIIIFYVVGGIIGPLAEEIFFRGMIYGYLRDRFATRHVTLGIATALTVSTLLFVLAHSGGSGIPLPQLVGGIVFCLSYEKEKSLLTPIIIHGSGNMAMFTLSLIGS